jgi:hypothetical protein
MPYLTIWMWKLGHSLLKFSWGSKHYTKIFIGFNTFNTLVVYIKVSSDQSTRQGDVLSPNIFNLFLNDFSDIIENSNDSVYLQEKKISCLLYADDLILISHYTKIFIGFNTFNTLVVYIKVSSDQSTRFIKDYYLSFVNVNFHAPVPNVNTVLHLFDHTICPILLYGCENWGTLSAYKINNNNLNLFETFKDCALTEPRLCINHWKVLYKLCVFYVDRNSKMTTTAGHSFYIQDPF